MTMTDPISDLLTRIRNGSLAKHEFVDIPNSKIKQQITEILKQEGFINDTKVIKQPVQDTLRVQLKYHSDNTSAIRMIKRVSKPGRRVYASADSIPRVLAGLGMAILTTSQGIMSDREARKRSIGGEVICFVA
jgi:small subunit ribosomal protein S8